MINLYHFVALPYQECYSLQQVSKLPPNGLRQPPLTAKRLTTGKAPT
jgi:hypothetical protein